MAGLQAPWNARLSPFQKLLVLRTLRPEKAVHGMAEWVEKTLGPKFARAPPFDLDEVYAHSSNTTPLLFILSPGADPTALLLARAGSPRCCRFGKILFCLVGENRGKVPLTPLL